MPNIVLSSCSRLLRELSLRLSYRHTGVQPFDLWCNCSCKDGVGAHQFAILVFPVIIQACKLSKELNYQTIYPENNSPVPITYLHRTALSIEIVRLLLSFIHLLPLVVPSQPHQSPRKLERGLRSSTICLPFTQHHASLRLQQPLKCRSLPDILGSASQDQQINRHVL